MEPFLEAHHRALLAAVLAIALLARLAVLASLRGSLYWTFLLWDERTYDGWARDILAGSPRFIYSLSPLPAFVVAAVYQVMGPDPLWVRLLHVAFGVATCWAVYHIGRELGGRAVGLLSALVAALYRPFVFLSVTLLKEPLGLLLFAALVYLFLSELREHRRLKLLALGVAAGLLGNVRQNAVVVLAVMGPAVLAQLHRKSRALAPVALAGALIGAGYLLPGVPFMIANQRGTGRLSPAPLAGFDLYLGNNLAGATPFWSPVPFASTSPDEQGIQFTIEASRREGRRLTLAEGSSYWAREVLRSARDHPAAFARRIGWKALALFDRHEESDNHSLEFMGAFAPVLRLPFLTFWLVMPLGVAGLAAAARQDARARWLAVAMLAYAATMVIWFSNMRIRAPLVLALVPFAVVGARGLLGAGGWSRRTRAAAAGVVLLVSALEALPLPGTGDLTAHYNTHALALAGLGRKVEAVGYWRASSSRRGAWSDVADLWLALYQMERGDLEEARRWLARIPDHSFSAAQKYDTLGTLRQLAGDLPGAGEALERSLAINEGQRGVQQKLLEVYRVIDPTRARLQEERLARVEAFYETTRTNTAGR